jgi:hypothetical protein
MEKTCEKDLKTAFQNINPVDFKNALKEQKINFSCSKYVYKSRALAKYKKVMSIIYAKMGNKWQSSSTDIKVQDRLNELKPGILERYEEFINTILKGDYSQCP